MRKRLIGFGLGFALLSGFLLSQAAVACATQTLIVDGKVTVCTVCGTVISCM
jgi:hypothetical protein